MFDPRREEQDYEDGVAYTRWLAGRRAALDAAPVRGEPGWTPELEAERESIERQINGGGA